MNEIYHECVLRKLCTQRNNGRYSVCVEISLACEGGMKNGVYHESEKFACILLQESEKDGTCQYKLYQFFKLDTSSCSR